MTDKALEGLMFAYESTAAASYLVVKCDTRLKVLDYQVSMAAVNKIEKMACFDMKCSNGYAYFYYNITSMLTLSLLLKRRKLARNEFIRLLADISRSLVDCEGYLLSGSNFILNVDYLYINPETLDISMVYIPMDTNCNVSSKLRDFILDLILKHADIDESDRDNFLQKILAAVKNELFNLPEFIKLLDSLLFGAETCNEEDKAGLDANKCAGSVPLNIAFSDGEIKQDKGFKMKPVLIILAIQLVLFFAAFLTVNYFRNKSNDSLANYSAIGIIAAALDVVAVKRLFKGKATSRQKAEKQSSIEDKEYRDFIDSIAPTGGRKDKVFFDVPENSGFKDSGNITGMNYGSNTEILGKADDGYPVLKGKGEADSERIVVNKPDFLIGRLSGQVDYMCKTNAVGKIHAQITNIGDVYMLKDLNSLNGTYINNIRIPSNVEYELKNGDNIAFANCEYVFHF